MSLEGCFLQNQSQDDRYHLFGIYWAEDTAVYIYYIERKKPKKVYCKKKMVGREGNYYKLLRESIKKQYLKWKD